MSRRVLPLTRAAARAPVLVWLVTVAVACSDGFVAPRTQGEADAQSALRWNEVARGLVVSHASSPPHASRTYAYVSLASLAAWQAARDAGSPNGTAPSPSAAAARAAATVLAFVYPGAAEFVSAELEAQGRARLARGESRAAREAGETVGEAVAQRALERARADGANAIWDNSFPEGPGYYTGRAPAHPTWGTVRPWFVSSGREMRAPTPPAFESEAFQMALREVREISGSRTAEQLAIALHWADGAGTVTPPGHWNVIAADLVRRHDLRESEALRTFALLNAAMADAMIGCWDTKFAYWYLRPWEADAAITTPIGRPNHPSYPSGHSCSSAAGATVLAGLFPSAAAAVQAMAEEASLSRLYGGIHYRFDLTAGFDIGRACGSLALAIRGSEPQFFSSLGWMSSG